MKTKTSLTGNSINRSPLRYGLFLTALALACFAFSPVAHAICQEGCLGNDNTVLGDNALVNNAGGFSNTAIGSQALANNTTGRLNTAVGYTALLNSPTGFFNIALGAGAGMKLRRGSNNIDIGNQGNLGDSNTMRIGTEGLQTTTYIAGVSGSIVADGVSVVVDSEGHLGTVMSSERYKDEIKPMDKASEAILALQPVTFRYKHDLDPAGIPQFGLVAEQVEKVNPALVARDADGKVYTVRYEAVNAMLLNEFLKEHKTVQEQGATIAELRQEIATLTAGLQRVSAQIELSKTAPQTVLNDQHTIPTSTEQAHSEN
jgi:trimeric autotransporter adhesin